MTSEKRVELIKKVASVIPKSVECTEYQVSKTTLSDIIKPKSIIFDYFSRNESDKEIQNKKAGSKIKVQSVDNAV